MVTHAQCVSVRKCQAKSTTNLAMVLTDDIQFASQVLGGLTDVGQDFGQQLILEFCVQHRIRGDFQIGSSGFAQPMRRGRACTVLAKRPGLPL